MKEKQDKDGQDRSGRSVFVPATKQGVEGERNSASATPHSPHRNSRCPALSTLATLLSSRRDSVSARNSFLSLSFAICDLFNSTITQNADLTLVVPVNFTRAGNRVNSQASIIAIIELIISLDMAGATHAKGI